MAKNKTQAAVKPAEVKVVEPVITDTPQVTEGEVTTGNVIEGEVIVDTNITAPTDEVSAADLAAGTAVSEGTVIETGEVGKQTDIPDVTVVTEGEGDEVVVRTLHPYCETILGYAKKMGPANIVQPLQLVTNQMELYQAVTGIVNNFEGQAFVEAYGQALEIMHENAPAFADNLLFRGVNNMRVPPQVRERYENILILMTSTANPEGRKAALEAISLDVLCKGFTSDVEQKIKGFYSNYLG